MPIDQSGRFSKDWTPKNQKSNTLFLGPNFLLGKMKVKTKTKTLRLSPSEAAALEKAASRQGIGFSAWARATMLKEANSPTAKTPASAS